MPRCQSQYFLRETGFKSVNSIFKFNSCRECALPGTKQSLKSEPPQKTPALALTGVLKADYIFLPFFVHTALNVFSHFKIKAAVRFPRRIAQRHSRFFWRAAAFIDIAAHAGGDEVFPSVASSARSGNHVIQRQIVPGITAVLTRVRVPVQDVPARKRNILIGNSDVMP